MIPLTSHAIVFDAANAAWLYLVAGALGTFARLSIGTSQKSITWRSVVEMLVGGVACVLMERIGVVEALPLAGEQFQKLDTIGRAAALFGASYIGGHIFRSIEHRIELKKDDPK